MRQGIAIIVLLLSAPAWAAPAESDYYRALRPRQKVTFGFLQLTCNAKDATVAFDDSWGLPATYAPEDLATPHGDLIGRGPLQESFADCRFTSEDTVRLKAGLRSAPLGQGFCGGSPPEILSVWINRRKVVVQEPYSETCGEFRFKSLTITATAVRICELSAAENPKLTGQFGPVPAQPTCRTITMDPNAVPDETEFPA